MKTLKKALVTGLVAVMMVVNLAGCGKFDAAAYVESSGSFNKRRDRAVHENDWP
jgi:uncharacterized lipoprotein YehR (DUF1307 family)